MSHELITAERDLAEQTGGELHVAVISGPAGEYAAPLNRVGVDVVHAADYGEAFNHNVYLQAVT